MTTDVDRSAAGRWFVIGSMVTTTVVAVAWFWVIYTDELTSVQRVVAIGTLLFVLAILAGGVTAVQAHRLGGWSRYRSFTRAIAKTGELPDDALTDRWRPRLVRFLAIASVSRVRVIWVWFGIVFSIVPQVVQGHTDPILLGVLVLVGAAVGLVVSAFAMSMQRGRLENARRLLEQIDERRAMDAA